MNRKCFINLDSNGKITSIIESTDIGIILPENAIDITNSKYRQDIIRNTNKYKIKNGKVIKSNQDAFIDKLP